MCGCASGRSCSSRVDAITERDPDQAPMTRSPRCARILADSPSLCTPTFIANVHKEMESSLYLKQVLVENADGVQYCDAFGRAGDLLAALGEPLDSRPYRDDRGREARRARLPVLKITQAFGTLAAGLGVRADRLDAAGDGPARPASSRRRWCASR